MTYENETQEANAYHGDIVMGNRLIAEFMGWKQDSQGFWSGCKGGVHYKLTFNSDWNHLMPVVEKIESEEEPVSTDPQKGTYWPYKVDILSRNSVEIWNHKTGESIVAINKDGISKIQSVWLAVVQFIQWYNNSPSGTISKQ